MSHKKLNCVQSPTTNQGLLFACWVIFSCIFQSADFFQNHLFQKTLSGKIIRVSSSLDADQAPHFVGPDLGPNCLEMLSADNKC